MDLRLGLANKQVFDYFHVRARNTSIDQCGEAEHEAYV